MSNGRRWHRTLTGVIAMASASLAASGLVNTDAAVAAPMAAPTLSVAPTGGLKVYDGRRPPARSR